MDFLNNILELLNNSFTFVFSFVVWVFNLIIWLICGLVNLFVNIFPDSPFNIDFTFGNDKYLGYLNWLIPIDIILNITFVWCGCMFIYWGYSVVMRWIKLID